MDRGARRSARWLLAGLPPWGGDNGYTTADTLALRWQGKDLARATALGSGVPIAVRESDY
jgi:hypothetical protein